MILSSVSALESEAAARATSARVGQAPIGGGAAPGPMDGGAVGKGSVGLALEDLPSGPR